LLRITNGVNNVIVVCYPKDVYYLWFITKKVKSWRLQIFQIRSPCVC